MSPGYMPILPYRVGMYREGLVVMSDDRSACANILVVARWITCRALTQNRCLSVTRFRPAVDNMTTRVDKCGYMCITRPSRRDISEKPVCKTTCACGRNVDCHRWKSLVHMFDGEVWIACPPSVRTGLRTVTGESRVIPTIPIPYYCYVLSLSIIKRYRNTVTRHRGTNHLVNGRTPPAPAVAVINSTTARKQDLVARFWGRSV